MATEYKLHAGGRVNTLPQFFVKFKTGGYILEFFIDKIYVYPDKMVLTFYYTDDRRELPFAETMQLINSRQRILDLMNSPRPEGVVPACALEMSLDDEEENPDFFP